MTWHLVARAGEIAPGKPKIVSVNNKEVGIFYENGRYFAVLNFCPHFGAPICQGKVFGTVCASEPGKQTYDHDRLVLRCPWHRWEFDLETGQPLTPIRQKLKTYAVQTGKAQTGPTEKNAHCEAGGVPPAATTYEVRADGVEIWIEM